MFAEDGGVALRVRASGRAGVDTSLCSKSPMIVRIGGPYSDLRADRRLVIGSSAAAQLGVTATADDKVLRVEAKGGLRFVEGTGAIPPAPERPYQKSARIDLGTCGWLFVDDGSSWSAVIQVGSIGWEQDPGGPRQLVLLYAPWPASPVRASGRAEP